jgi:hypothetical protein
MVWFEPSGYASKPWLGFWVLGISAGVYLTASLIDLIRKHTIEIVWGKWIDRFVPQRLHKE